MLRIYIMLLFIIKWAILSLLLIFLIHYLYSFFKSTLTIPKVRDLVNKPTERYNEMIDTIKYNDTVKYNDTIKYKDKGNGDKLNRDKININRDDNMQDELSIFLQDLKKNNVSREIVSSNDGHSNTFSNY